MNSQSNAGPDSLLDSEAIRPAALSETRPLYWSVRREVWENRSIYVAPLAIAAVYLLSFAISVIWLPNNMREVWMPHTMREMATLKVTDSLIGLAMPYSHAAMLIGLIAFLVGIFYSLDALHGERRDRSILFWKSLPVSDLTTMLSKAAIPLVVLPLIVFAVTVVLHQIMRLLSIAVLVMNGGGAGTLWNRLPLSEMELVTLYGTAVLVLWHAPIYCWFLLVSGWARRAVFLWAVVPWLAIAAMENIAFHTSFLGSMLQGRLFGFTEAAFDLTDKNGVAIDPHFIPLEQLAPGRFLISPSLWVGLIFAGACFAAAVRLRRYREPL
ncbi:MAG: ABC transporter permease [Terriglobales bacterium]